MKKRLCTVLTSMAMGLWLSITGCGPAESIPTNSLDSTNQGLVDEMATDDCIGRKIRVAWLGSMPEEAYDAADFDGAKAVAQYMGGTVQPFYSSFDGPTQLQQCNQAATSGNFDAIVVIPADNTGIIPCVQAASSHGVSIVAADVSIGTDPNALGPQVPGQTGAVLEPAASFGEALAPLVVSLCGTSQPCNIIYLAGFLGVSIDKIALQDLTVALKSHPNIKLVATQEAFYDSATAQQITAGILAQTPNIQVIITSADQMAKGAEAAVNAAHLQTQPKIIGAGAGAYAVDAVKAGRWAATFMALPYDEGWLGTRMAIRAARGHKVIQDGIDPVVRRGFPLFFTTANQSQLKYFIPEWPG